MFVYKSTNKRRFLHWRRVYSRHKGSQELFMAECEEYNSWDEMMEEGYSDVCYYTEQEIDEECYFDENGNLIEQSN